MARQRITSNGTVSKDATATDPQLLRDFSTVKSYTAGRSGITYPGIRVFYRPHPKAAELPKDPAPLPLLVFVHGLGGSISQFHPLLGSLVNSASCLAVDLPGCGLSHFAPTIWDAYTTDALLDLLETVINEYRVKDQGVVFIAHSMGTVLAARLSNPRSTHRTLTSHVMGLIAICPVAEPPSEEKVRVFRRLLWIPEFLFNIWRAWDRWGGPDSVSVKRYVGPGADLETRQLQDRFNSQSRSPVFRRMAWGSLPVYTNGKPSGGLFGEPVWAGLNFPVYLVGGKHDEVTPPKEIEKIERILNPLHVNGDKVSSSHPKSNDSATAIGNETPTGAPIPDSAAPVDTGKPNRDLPTSIESISNEDFEHQHRLDSSEDSFENPTTPRDMEVPQNKTPPQPKHPAKVVKTILLPAGHAVLYSKYVRTLAGLISDFMNDQITGRFSLGWQLQYLSREGKWDVKNLVKWQKVEPVSEPIGGIFRAMKTLREVDDEHTPRVFTEKWGTVIKDIVDISHDNPVYDPRNFGSGIKYHKLPTVSKVPPTDTDVANFIKLIDEIREDQKARAATESGWSDEYVVGVHCHYGFNRTGYFLVCYLVERCGYDVQAAIKEFSKGRPRGIHHSHFVDRLALRYSGQEE